MDYKKVPEQINNFINDNVQALAQLFPSAVKDGQVDFAALKEELGQFEEVDKEKYELTWAGKQDAKKKAQEDVYGRTLKYIEKDSKNPDTTENLYIEGDNLEVLKLLRQNYYGAIKMIYIDPPYNKDKDFVYNDYFIIDEIESDIAEGHRDEYGKRLVSNTKSSNRFHAKWLNMMYPRLKLAKDLLTNDGVIFISIDDTEDSNIRKLCNEIFGEENFINIVSVNMKNTAGASGGGEDKRLKKNIEYMLAYAKNYNEFSSFSNVYEYTEMSELIQNYIDEGISWKYTSVLVYEGDKEYIGSTVDGDGNEIKVYLRKNPITKSIKQMATADGITEKEAYKKYGSKIFRTTNAQSSIRTRVMGYRSENNITENLLSIEYTPKTGKNKGKLYEQFYKDDKCNLFVWLRDTSEEIDGVLYKKDLQGTYWDFTAGTKNLTKEGSIPFPNGKKPVVLMERLLEMQTDENSVIMDFFSGSASMAHAVMQLNAKDNGKRKFIMVQLPENMDELLEKSDFTTKKDIQEQIDILDGINKPHYLTEIGKERVRRAGEKIKEEIETANAQLKIGEEPKQVPDIGFKVFRTSDTNIKWNIVGVKGQIDSDTMTYTPDLLDFTFGFKDIDVVYEVMLRQKDVPLSEKLETLMDIGSRTYLYGSAYLVCLETEITEELIDKLAALDPLPIKFVFRDSAFKDDINLKDETFRRLKNLIERNSGLTKKTYTVEFI